MALTEPNPPTPDKPLKSKRRFPWRRLLQYRLRTLLILTTIIAIALGWWSHKARQQREAVAALEQVGATVKYDTRLPWTSGMQDPPQWPQWLLDKVGVDFFASVQEIWLDNTKVTDAGLEHLKNLTALQALALDNTQVTDAGLEHLKGLTALRWLGLRNTQVTDAGLEHLKNLTALQGLDLDSTKVTDAGLEHLKGLTALRWLGLRNTQVTNAGLEHLKNLTALQGLYLDNTQVTDAGLARLRQSLPNCKIIH